MTLADLQAWMSRLVTHPEGVRAGLGEHDAAAVIAPSATLSAEQRLAIYNRAYHARLFGVFDEVFPGLLRLVGAPALHAFAHGYLQAHPPRGHTLDTLCAAFPAWLGATRPDAAAPEPGVDALVDLAAFEWAWHALLDGPGLEGAPPVRTPDAPCVPSPAASFARLRLRAPMHRWLRAALATDQPVPLPAPADTRLALARVRWRVIVTELDPDEDAALARMDGRTAFDAARVRAWAARGWVGVVGRTDAP